MEDKFYKRKMRWLKFGIIVCSVILFLSCALIGFRAYFTISVEDYYSYSEKSFIIPEINDGFVPQGMDFDDRSNCFFLGGYTSNKTPSPIYMVNKSTGELEKKVLLKNSDGSDFFGHAGGLKVNGEFVYVAGGADYCIYVYSYSDVLSAKNGDSVTCLGKFDTAISPNDKIRVSFLTKYNDTLIAGEFYREGNYSTPTSHKLTTTGGDYNQALAVAYEFSNDNSAVFGLKPTPVCAYSLPDKVQGMCFYDGKAFVSTSYGLDFSQIYVYAQSALPLETTEFSVSVYSFDKTALIKSNKIAPMSEELVAVDGKLYIACESASNKYIFGKLTSSEWCYASDVTKMI